MRSPQLRCAQRAAPTAGAQVRADLFDEVVRHIVCQEFEELGGAGRRKL